MMQSYSSIPRFKSCAAHVGEQFHVKTLTTQVTYMLRNTEARSQNRCSRGKAIYIYIYISIIYSVCVCVYS
jgi:hypothetical protein